jgi:hypothetical protein
MEVRLRPCRPDPLQPLRNTFFESLNTLYGTSYNIEDQPGLVIANVLPGHTRPLVWTTLQANRTHSPPLSNFYSHIHDVQGKEEAKEWDMEEDSIYLEDDLDDKNMSKSMCFSQKPPRADNGAKVVIPVDLRKALKYGIKGIAWDDWSGRLFVATLNDCMIHVIDLAQGPKEGDNLQPPLYGGLFIVLLVI